MKSNRECVFRCEHTEGKMVLGRLAFCQGYLSSRILNDNISTEERCVLNSMLDALKECEQKIIDLSPVKITHVEM